MELFTNEVFSVANLPKYEAAETTPIDPKFRKVITINFFINFFIIGIVLSLSVFLIEVFKPYAWYVIIAYFFLMCVVFFLQQEAFRKRSFALRERDIIYRRGILSTITTIIPFNRIQHVSINEGFISRRYQLAQLQIFTAGGSSGDIKISGLKKEDAEKMKELIMQRITKKESSIEETKSQGNESERRIN